MPAVSAGEPSTTPRTSRPSRSSSPTERRRRVATSPGASATPSRSRSKRRPSAIAPTASRRVLVDGSGEVEAVLETVGVDPDDPPTAIQHRCARRPRTARGRVLDGAGDRAAARATEPSLGGGHLAPRRPPAVASGGHGDDHVAGFDGVVGPGERRARRRCRRRAPRGRRRRRCPRPTPCTVRSSAKRTSVVSSRRLWALVTTRPGATTNPLPRPWRPMPTTDGACRHAGLADEITQLVDRGHVELLVGSHYRIASDSRLRR